ncbi:MAG: hypothetical protein AB7O43_12570 [Hyphomicrobiaceae bacterium]
MQIAGALAALVAGVFAVTAAAFPCAAAKRSQFTSAGAIQEWINGYRAKPEPDKLPVALKAMSDLGVFRDVDSAGLYFGFAAGVLSANPKRAETLIARSFPMPPSDQVAIVRAIAWSGMPQWKTVMRKFIERMPARKVLIERHLYGKLPDLMNLPLDESPVGLDALWGYYYATGSAVPVRRIVSILPWSKEQNSVDKLTVGNMAKLTLAINASRDVDLVLILRRELPKQNKQARLVLSEVIEAAETFETGKIRKQALAAIEELKRKGPESARRFSWWGQAGQTALAIGCVAASAMGQVQVGIPCVVGGAASSAALKLFTPQQ